MSAARIAVDARPLCYPGTGIGRYTHELLARLCHMGGEWFLYAHQDYDRAAFDLPNVHHRSAGIPPALRGSQLGQLWFPLWARRDRVQALWGPRHQLPPLLPAGLRTVLTVHDLVWKEYGDTMRFPGRQVESLLTPRALARADVIAVVSEFTRGQLQRYFPQWAHKVTLVPGASLLLGHGSAPLQSGGTGSGYYLFVGTLEPRKNLPRLLRAYARYVREAPQPRSLRVAGGGGWGGQDIGALVAELGLESQVQLMGKVDGERLLDLYRGAHALLMPSLYEGFGLPVVEALSVGVPAIVSRDSAMEEVGGAACVLVDPLSEADICAALAKLDRDTALHASLAGRALAQAQRYSWDDSANKMARLLLQ
ncbi:MAG: glycosyltransferase family 4 protein [Halieaceae bacterium]|nr:glycosyltransferase family 4 protein [Halieaceae bacterium]MCP5204718.1 glycosyltransferase family 4 protein [Pseudomonadales bacterium]